MVRLGNIIQNSTVDWLGHVSIVYLFAGCNFRCGFCYNHKLMPLDSGTEYPDEYMKEAIDENVTNDAVMATGGEPTLQPKSVEYLFDCAHKAGLLTVLNTNGTNAMPIADLHEKGLLDHVAMDIKAPLHPSPYLSQIGLRLTEYLIPAAIRMTLKVIKERNIPLEIRTTSIKDTYSSGSHIYKLIDQISEFDLESYHIQQFDDTDCFDKSLKGKVVEREELIEYARYARKKGIKNVYVITFSHGLEKI